MSDGLKSKTAADPLDFLTDSDERTARLLHLLRNRREAKMIAEPLSDQKNHREAGKNSFAGERNDSGSWAV